MKNPPGYIIFDDIPGFQQVFAASIHEPISFPRRSMIFVDSLNPFRFIAPETHSVSFFLTVPFINLLYLQPCLLMLPINSPRDSCLSMSPLNIVTFRSEYSSFNFIFSGFLFSQRPHAEYALPSGVDS